MKLRSLSLLGFKSFADRTELRFHDGITAIVGPNGCGKSNISDAIRWVLGEQRASAIRGAKMEEAIFQGTTQRRPVNRAEVTLSFSNEEGRLALPQREVEIRRIVFREGGSDYQLNRQSTRLRDILDLCRDTGLGANAYTVIEQGMVDSILSDRADERRHLFEEAAGIGRYKDRRKGAQRRLEAAESDLARLEDLVAEVDSKVRNLARQRRKAQRYTELRARRLALEIAVAGAELERVRLTIDETAARLKDLTQSEPAARAALSTAEAELERRRLESADAGRHRNEAAARLEEVARQIGDRERELAVADERRAHAERRIVQIAAERDESGARREALDAEIATIEAEHSGQRRVVEALGGRVGEVQERHAAVRQQVTAVRRADEEARAVEGELTRQLARLDAEAVGADARAAEASQRLEHLATERGELAAELQRLDEQGDLFIEQARVLSERVVSLREEVTVAEQRLAALRQREEEARRALTSAEDAARRLAGRVESLEAVHRDFQGFAPAVAAVLGARAELAGLDGPVAEFLRLEPERASRLEAALGSLLQVLVVEDAEAAARVRAWLAGAQAEPGGVALLRRADLPELERLLDTLEFGGAAPGEPVLLGRREKLEALRGEASRAAADVEARAGDRRDLADRLSAAELELRERQRELHDAGLELRRAEAEEVTRAGQRGRAQRLGAELERRRGELESTVARARRDAAAARKQRARVESDLKEHRTRWQLATGSLAEHESAWETIRDEEAELRVSHARAEGSLTALERRLAGARDELHQTRIRLGALDREEAEHDRALTQLAGVRTGSGARLEELFAQRDALAVELRALDERLADAADAALALETRVRGLRRSTDESLELRHRLELERAEADAAARRVRDRLEAEWGRPYELLAAEAEPAEGEPDILRAELAAVTADIERLGPINMLALEEHEEESRRLAFLQTQRDDLVKARDDLQSAIRQINKTARDLFNDTFEQIRHHFKSTFQTLFEGGECDVRLEDAEDPLESPIDIIASPRGKRTQRIHLLSGGERALTALALLFAIYLVKPSPFCVLDEVDAPLDEANIGRFIAMLQRFKVTTQFIVITHNPRTMEAADWLYGVTMEEPGVSSIVGVHLEEVLAGAGAAG
jgi:chromosome segregation protein